MLSRPNLYAQRRAAGLCGACGKVKSASARCEACVIHLADYRAARRNEEEPTGMHGGAKPATLDDVAEAMGLTRERVRQIEEVALTRFRRRMESNGWTSEEALRGLAMLGVLSGEQYTPAPREVVRCAHYEERSYTPPPPRSTEVCFGVGERIGKCGAAVADHPRRGAYYCRDCNATLDGWADELDTARVGGVAMALAGRA